jgi:polysaccharide biosynthesis/export protein
MLNVLSRRAKMSKKLESKGRAWSASRIKAHAARWAQGALYATVPATVPAAVPRQRGVLLRALFAFLLALQVSGPARAQAPAAPEYRLGPGDVVRISVYQSPDLSLEARIGDAGSINYPLLGSVRLGGLGVTQAERAIADGLRNGNFLKQPQVSLLIVQVRGNQVSVLGQVNRPGRFPIETADMRLTDLLATAGGVAPLGADTITLVGTRNGQPFRKELDLPGIVRSERRGDDVFMQNGDVVYVERAPVVYIYGEVQRPGAMRLERGMTVMQALATGGGTTQRGTDRGMRIHRKGSDGKTQILQPSMDDLVREGDVVYVRESLF